MALFSSRKYPKTAKYEAKLTQLNAAFERFNSYKSSEELKRINTLDILTSSSDFKAKVKKLKSEKFKDTAEYRQLSKFMTLKKSSDFKRYFKYIAAGTPEKVVRIENSDKRKELIELSEYVRSSEFYGAKSEKGFKNTEAYQKFKKQKALKKDSEIRFYNKQINSSRYKNYLNIHGSERLKQYKELEQEVTSEKFLSFKCFMEDKKKFDKSEEHSILQEYSNLKKSPDFIWYQKAQKKYSFKEIENLELSFEDDFNTNTLKSDKWITGYYWGKALLNKVYVLENEKQFFKDENISITGVGAKLTTQAESNEGLVWDSKRGFMPKTFDYSSAIISTGQSYRQLYGRVEAKVRVEHAHPVNHVFWMVGEKMAPQIDIFRFNDTTAQSFNAGIHIMNGNGPEVKDKVIRGASFDSDYYIYALEWTKDKITWFINGVKVNEQTENIPTHPMYIVFSSHISKEITSLNSPASMHIDWVKSYKFKN